MADEHCSPQPSGDGGRDHKEDIGDDADVATDKPAFDTKRATEDPNQMMDFDALLATLVEEAVAPVTK